MESMTGPCELEETGTETERLLLFGCHVEEIYNGHIRHCLGSFEQRA